MIRLVTDEYAIVYPCINAKSVAYFFGVIRETYPLSQKIHIILDGAAVTIALSG